MSYITESKIKKITIEANRIFADRRPTPDDIHDVGALWIYDD